MSMADPNTPSLEQLDQMEPSFQLTTSSSEFDPSLPRPPRVVFEPQNTAKGTIYVKNNRYTGSWRVNAQNRFDMNAAGQALGPYDEERDAKNELYKLDDVDRRAILLKVQKVLGGSYKPSSYGLKDTDFYAFKQVIRQANAMGRTWDVALDYMAQNPGVMEGTGRSYRLTSSDDIRYVAQETAIRLLGRGLDPRAMQRIIRAVQGEDVRAAQSGTRESAPSLQVQAEQQVMKQDPKEAMMQGAATIGEMLTKALGGT
jgi:hypothetical protein